MRTPTLQSLESRRMLSSAAMIGPLAEHLPPTPVDSAVVRGNVFRDVNRNAVRDSGEPGQPNIKVYLDYNNNGTRDGDAEPIAITNSLGSYAFTAARAPATIAVRLLLTGTHFTQTLPTGNGARTVTTTVGANIELEPFGVNEPTPTPPPPPPPAATILTGIVYTDKNGNGLRETTELGRPNVKVYLDNNNNGLRDGDAEPLVITNSEGRYSFTSVPTGVKTIRLLLTGTNLTQTQPSDGQPVHATVIANQTVQADAFGVHEISPTPPPPPPPPVTTGTIRGRVFNDVNHNGQIDPGDAGVNNRLVYLDVNHSGFRDDGDPQTFTNIEGRYSFVMVPVGTYNVRLFRGDLTQTSPPNNGSNVAVVTAGGIAGDLNFGTYRTIALLLPSRDAPFEGDQRDSFVESILA